ncbi:MAG TPA: hypothetical protein VMF09_02560 [Solirubrobacteraceae bacterium]|nr:hypothetical protein [Solirubrobacteraceae bacterium]
MHVQIRQPPVPLLAGCLAVAVGAGLWRLGIEFESVWLRSCGGPLLGEDEAGRPVAVLDATRLGHGRAGAGERSRAARARARSLVAVRS